MTDRTDTPSGRRRAASAPGRRPSPLTILTAVIPLLTIGALALVRPADPAPAVHPPTTADLARSTLVCPDAVPGSERVLLAHAAGATGVALVVLLFRAFASGCTALTGVEAIANGVPAFQKPKSRNAARTLVLMGALAMTMFVGITALAMVTDLHAAPGAAQAPDVFRFAADVDADQRADIRRMRAMLASIPPAPSQRPSPSPTPAPAPAPRHH